MTEFYLGVDIGTYSSKGVLVNQHGEVIAEHVIAHRLDVPQEGGQNMMQKQFGGASLLLSLKPCCQCQGSIPVR